MSSNLSLGFSKVNLRMGKSPTQKIYEFEDFRFDAEHLMLYRRGEAITLAPKAAETLLALIEAGGEIVSKDELIERIWPDSFVEESNLFLYLSILRRTLGEQVNGEPFLETLRRRGYRFTGDIRSRTADNGDNGNAAGLALIKPIGAAKPDSLINEQTQEIDDAKNVTQTPRVPLSSRWYFVGAAGVALALVVAAVAYTYFVKNRSIHSIAVMPFTNETGDKDLEYLSDGMTIELIGSLQKIPDLDVKAWSTMFRYKGTTSDALTIGKDLNVEAVLSPKMVYRDDNLTLYLELVDSKTGNSLWQETYNKTKSQLAALPTEVIRDVVQELRLDVADSTRQQIAKNYSRNTEAWLLYMRGRLLVQKITEPEVREGLVYLRQATEKDPSYAPAWAMIASGLRALTLCCDVNPLEMVEAKSAAEQAIALDPDLSEAQSALASNLYYYDWNFTEAEKHFLRALELDPNSAISHFEYGDFLFRMGRADESKLEWDRAMQLDPDSPFFNAFALFGPDQKTAIDRIRYTIDLNPNFYFAHFAAAAAYHRMKMYPEAQSEFQRAKELAPEQTWTDVNLSRMLVEMGEVGKVRAILDQLLIRSRSRYVPPFHIAMVYKQLGKTEQALTWLEKAYQIRDPKMTYLKTTGWKKLEDDPRYQDIYRRMKFPE